MQLVTKLELLRGERLTAIPAEYAQVHAPSGVHLLAALCDGDLVVDNFAAIWAEANPRVLAHVVVVEATVLSRGHCLLRPFYAYHGFLRNRVAPTRRSFTANKIIILLRRQITRSTIGPLQQ